MPRLEGAGCACQPPAPVAIAANRALVHACPSCRLAFGKLPLGLVACKALWAAVQPMLSSAARVEAPRAAATLALLEHRGGVVHLELGPACDDPRDCAGLLASVDVEHLRSLALHAHPRVFSLLAGLLPRLPALKALDLLGSDVGCGWRDAPGMAAAVPMLRSLNLDRRKIFSEYDEQIIPMPASMCAVLASATRLRSLSLVTFWETEMKALLDSPTALRRLRYTTHVLNLGALVHYHDLQTPVAARGNGIKACALPLLPQPPHPVLYQ